MSLFIEKIGLLLKVAGLGAFKITPATIRFALFTFPVALVKFLGLQTWDLGLFLGNILTPQRKKGSVVAPGKPGHGGVWPEFIPPTKTDARSPCPYLSELHTFFTIRRKDTSSIQLTITPLLSIYLHLRRHG